MTIRNAHSYLKGVWDWSILRGCFGNTKIEPTDIDGCIERNGRKLFLETKQPGKDIPFGQKLLLDSLVSDGHTVLVIWGERDKPSKIQMMTPYETIDHENATIETLRRLVTQWFDWANGNAVDKTEPAQTARAFWRRKGREYCDVMIAEWMKLDEREKLRRAASSN